MNKPASLPLPAGFGERVEWMQTFVRIVEAGNLTAAAAQLGITQPTISRRLQALERSLGVRLLQRSTHTMRLTADGERCYERAKELLADWSALESDLRGAGDAPHGVLRVIAPHAFGQERLIAPLTTYLRRFPRVSVEWLLHDDRAVGDFITHGIDCAIQVGEVTDSALVAIRLTEVPRIVAVAPSVLAEAGLRTPPTDPAVLAQLPWVALRTYYLHEVTLRRTRAAGGVASCSIPISPRVSTDSLYALRQAMLRGLGVGVSSAWVLAEDLAAGRLVQLVPDWEAAPLPVSLVYPYARFYPARLRQFVEIMKAEAAQALGTGAPGSDLA
jgi:DNA-binding transcriptional LysR family regulator